MRRGLAVELGERLLVGKRSARQEFGEACAALALLVRVECHGPFELPKLASVCSSDSSRAIAILAPKHLADLRSAVLHPSQNEEQVREPVEVLARGIAHRLALRETHQRALGAPAHGSRNVRQARGARSAGKDEFLE